MASLPIPAKMFFSFDLVTYSIKRDSKIIASAQDPPNRGSSGAYISFLIGTDIDINDVLITADDENFNVTRVSYDTYNGKQELIKAYY
ncbi:hypothetical protein ACFTQ7_12870 [Lysinibacillus sp. NPDC056959]|uniref:hypothetical protein n=1 Tax=Lysinibacillus sp. NPDC056959 TaxID=3345981 RepID=UPI003639FFE0